MKLEDELILFQSLFEEYIKKSKKADEKEAIEKLENKFNEHYLNLSKLNYLNKNHKEYFSAKYLIIDCDIMLLKINSSLIKSLKNEFEKISFYGILSIK